MNLKNRKNIDRIKEMALNRYHGCHDNRFDVNGPEHWKRVWQNAQLLIPITHANATVVELFCFLHDCCRIHAGHEPEHGHAAERFIQQHEKEFSFLDETEYQLLLTACGEHTHLNRSEDMTIATCWDANRLDLGRLGISPKAQFLMTEAAKNLEFIHRDIQSSTDVK
ncbi:MAG: hypothetical protein V7782_14110 [Psychromonas sp.]